VSGVLFGSGAAVCWAASTLLMASAARRLSPEAFGILFLGYQTLVLVPFATFDLVANGVVLSEVWPVVIAGVAEALGILAFGRSLRDGDVGAVAALVSLEGGFAALFAVTTGDSLSTITGIGMFAASAGGLVVGVPRFRLEPAPGAGFALLTALMFGVTLWQVGRSELSVILSLFGFSAVAAAGVLIANLGGRSAPQSGRWWPSGVEARQHQTLLCAAVTSVGGYALLKLGAQADAFAVTAVIGAQFSVLAAVGGFLLWRERLAHSQIAGVLLLSAGVGLISLGAA
jgi:drug/metabolite transporter (DMT)-like permease